MSYSRWSSSDWYTFWDASCDHPSLAVWHCNVEPHQSYRVELVAGMLARPESIAGIIPGYDESPAKEQEVLIGCMERFVEQVKIAYPYLFTDTPD